jgi:hypothetical protein
MLQRASRMRVAAEIGALLAFAMACSSSSRFAQQTSASSSATGVATTTSGTTGTTGGGSTGGWAPLNTSSTGSTTAATSTTGGAPDAGCGCDAGTFCDPLGAFGCLQCLTDAECAGTNHVCQNDSSLLGYGECFPCTAAESTCPAGEVCDLDFGRTYQECVPDCRLSTTTPPCPEIFFTPWHCTSRGVCGPGCATDVDCPAGTPRCRLTDGQCVPCLSPNDCPYSQPGCVRDACGTCQTSNDCPTGLTCDDFGRCVCTDDGQCGGDAPLCLPSAFAQDGGICGCSATGDCVLGTACLLSIITPSEPGVCIPSCNDGGTYCPPYAVTCNTTTGLCGPCTGNDSCIGDPAGAICGPNGFCTCNGPADCSQTTACEPTYPSQCIPSCLADGGTSCFPKVCDPGSGLCAPCILDSDCASADAGACYLGACVQCDSPSQCPASNPGCNSGIFACGSCASDRDCPAALPHCTASPFGSCTDGGT